MSDYFSQHYLAGHLAKVIEGEWHDPTFNVNDLVKKAELLSIEEELYTYYQPVPKPFGVNEQALDSDGEIDDEDYLRDSQWYAFEAPETERGNEEEEKEEEQQDDDQQYAAATTSPRLINALSSRPASLPTKSRTPLVHSALCLNSSSPSPRTPLWTRLSSLTRPLSGASICTRRSSTACWWVSWLRTRTSFLVLGVQSQVRHQ